MPMVPTAFAGLIVSNFAASDINGTGSVPLANAIATGIVSYLTSAPAIVQTIDVGTAGAGSGLGIGVEGVVPTEVAGAILGNLAAASIVGSATAPMVTAICNALSDTLATATVTTVNIGVGVGTGVGFLIGLDPGQLASQMIGLAPGFGLNGTAVTPMFTGIANGITDTLNGTTIVNVVIVGPPSIVPSGGTGIGFLS